MLVITRVHWYNVVSIERGVALSGNTKPREERESSHVLTLIQCSFYLDPLDYRRARAYTYTLPHVVYSNSGQSQRPNDITTLQLSLRFQNIIYTFFSANLINIVYFHYQTTTMGVFGGKLFLVRRYLRQETLDTFRIALFVIRFKYAISKFYYSS